MQLVAGRLVLSPSDLNGHVECEHLTALALEVAPASGARPLTVEEFRIWTHVSIFGHWRGSQHAVFDTRDLIRDILEASG